MSDALIIDACRTPRGIGKPGKGALAHLHPQHLASTVLRALVERNGFDTADVDDVIWGTSSQVCEQSGDLGRMAALDAGYDTRASGVTLDRFCGSGITSTNFAANAVMAGMEDLVISGGTEMMSLPKKGLLPMGANNAHLQELHPQPHQGVCADAIASLEGIPRTALDAHAAESQARADRAIKEGRYDRSLIPVLNLDGTLGPSADTVIDDDGIAVLRRLAQGQRLGEAAAALHLSRRTADRRLAAARDALGAASTVEAIVIAKERGLLA